MSASIGVRAPTRAAVTTPAAPEPDDTLASLAIAVPPLRQAAAATTAYEAFTRDGALYAIPVVDDHGMPLGLINRFRFLETVAQPAGQDFLQNRPVAMAMDRAPLVLDEHVPLDQVSQILSDDHTKYIFDGFVVTRQGKYLGIGTGYSLMRRLTEQRQSAMAQLAYHDTLTGLPNRQLFLDRLHQALASAARNRRRVALLHLDLDRFKDINDEYGHSVGDLLVQETANRFRGIVRGQDTVARLAGDEFAFVITELAALEHADLVAQKLMDLVRQPYILDGHEIRISCSVGLVTYPDHADSQALLLRMADDAVYAAKRLRNTAERYSPEMARPASRGPLLFSTVRRAIDLGQLEVYYQPLVHLRTGRLHGMEALVRWNDPSRGMVPTSELIQLAEDAGLISDITDFVCGASMRQLRTWRAAGLGRDLRLSINVAASEVRDGVLAPMIRDHVRAAGLPMSAIDLELTESGLMYSDAAATELLSELRADGIHVSVDDFGTGYSSLGRLQRLPVDVLKIDRAFIDGIDTGTKQGALVRAIVAMAHSLELTVVAEGVETEGQRAFLAEHDCDLYQGYLFSPPVPPEKMTRLLEADQRMALTTTGPGPG